MMTEVDKGEMIQQVLDRYDIRYKPNYNGWQTIHCPAVDRHPRGDRNPSARVNVIIGGFKCMACLLSGDAFTLLMEIEGVDFLQAKEQLGNPVVRIESDYLI